MTTRSNIPIRFLASLTCSSIGSLLVCSLPVAAQINPVPKSALITKATLVWSDPIRPDSTDQIAASVSSEEMVSPTRKTAATRTAASGADRQVSQERTLDKGNANLQTKPSQNLFSKEILSSSWLKYVFMMLTLLNSAGLIALSLWIYRETKSTDQRYGRQKKGIESLIQHQDKLHHEQKQLNLTLAETKGLIDQLNIRLSSFESKTSKLIPASSEQKDALLESYPFQQLSSQSRHASVYPPVYADQNWADQQEPLANVDEVIAQEYQEAFTRNDRSALRRMMSQELNITDDSEEALMKSSVRPTQLEVVKNGGSYLLISREHQHWLVPEFQILTTFTTNQLAKGIFSYRRESISSAQLRRPAEVRDVGGLWEVIRMGVIAVPL